MAETNTMDVIFVDYLLPNEPEGTTPHHVTLKEFLALPQDQLTEQNQKVQKVLGQLYQLNDREPPLYHSFPKRNVGPLIIDCTPICNPSISFTACYYELDNCVGIKESALELTELSLLGVFAHELKHAEQFSEETYKIYENTQEDDGLGFHQLEYLAEAQAYAFGGYVEYLVGLNSSDGNSLLDVGSPFELPMIKEYLPILERHTKDKSVDNFSDIEYEIMEKILPILYYTQYRRNYDRIKPISKEDKGLTEDDIPNSFHFKNPREAFLLLKDMPREAMTPAEKISIDIRMTIDEEDCIVEDLGDCIILRDDISPDELLNIIKTEFTRSPEDGFERRIQKNKDVLKFFLSFRMYGKPLMQEKDILDLLDGARASGRKDVEEAIQEYQKECLIMSPKDKYTKFIADSIHRVIENHDDISFFGTVSASDMSNAMVIEFTRPIENGSEKYINYSKFILKDMLSTQHRYHQDVDISKLLEGARASGRKDVEEAMREYHKEYPSDKRFSEEMFDPNPKDKVAEFVQRQERKAAEVKLAAENAANKGVSAVTAAVKAAKSK